MGEIEKDVAVLGVCEERFSRRGSGESYPGGFNAEGRSEKGSENSSSYNEILPFAVCPQAPCSCFFIARKGFEQFRFAESMNFRVGMNEGDGLFCNDHRLTTPVLRVWRFVSTRYRSLPLPANNYE